jgi:hypothetical protein
MATKTSHLVRPLVALVALVAAMAALLLAYSASPTLAAGGSCSTTSGTTKCTFASTGKEDTFVVPAGVSTIHVLAIGAPGGVGESGDSAGRGAHVSADLTVTPGQTLYVNVGGAATSDDNRCDEGVACVGGFNGGASGVGGGGGGGASDVRTVSREQDASLPSRLIVAGGGGGSGVGVSSEECGDLIGAHGGDAGSDGGDGAWCGVGGAPAGGTGGVAGGQSAGGSGGFSLVFGQSGSLGLGGEGGQDDGGAGGGGYYGGGGGGSTNSASDVNDDGRAPAGGGGGGSNLVPDGGSATISNGIPSIVISYQGGLGEEPPTEPEDKQACKKGGYEALGFKNQGQCIKAVNTKNAKN